MTREETSFDRRSAIHESMSASNPHWGVLSQMPIPLSFSLSDERERFEHLALCDLSCLTKIGLRGPEALSWIENQGIGVPLLIHDWSPMKGEGLIVRTDRHEVFIEDGPHNQIVPLLAKLVEYEQAKIYWEDRQDASLLLGGALANLVLVETCGFDFNSGYDRLVKTRLAGVSCSVLPFRLRDVAAFRIWTERSYGAYLWRSLLEIAESHGGGAVGLGCLYPEVASLTDQLTSIKKQMSQ
jgi:sarcosine oxidase subunit gamma